MTTTTTPEAAAAAQPARSDAGRPPPPLPSLPWLLEESVKAPERASASFAGCEPAVHALHRQEGRGGLYPYQALAEDLLGELPERKINVLCTAPTGAGKSFLIEAAARVCRRVGAVLCVAEPLIALAEQMHERLVRAGLERSALLTGPSRRVPGDEIDVYVCTYEVLARMCQGQHAAVSAACLCVVIDEVHYLAGDRGVVLQEILHACGQWRICVVALSGTLPNDRQVASFLSAVNGFDTCIIGMKERPVKLKHYFWDVAAPPGCRFTPIDVAKLKTTAAPRGGPLRRAGDVEALGGLRGRQDLLKLLRDLLATHSQPVLIVAFSCRKLTEWAQQAACLPGLLDRQQRSRVSVAFDALMRAVPPEDAELFQPLRALGLEGVFMHHSHLPVPYLELVSRLAECRCAPVVFSSSTLSAGINLPVKTVVLTGFKLPQRQPDGTVNFELLEPLLLHQLCGRAGRPGYEPEGFVVIVGRGPEGHAAAGALLARPLAPVVPSEAFGPGDVLRAVQLGRCLTLDPAVFADTLLRRVQILVGLSCSLAAQALAHLPQERRALVARLARTLEHLEAAQPALRPYARARGAWLSVERATARGEVRFVAKEGDGGRVAPPASEAQTTAAWNFLLRAPQPPPKAVPLQYAGQVLHLRECAQQLAQEAGSGGGLAPQELAALAVAANAEIDKRALQDASAAGEELMQSLQRRLQAQGLLDGASQLTLAGGAGAVVRSCAEPAAVVRFLTGRAAELADRPQAFVEAAALLLGEGSTSAASDDEGRASVEVLGSEVASLLQTPSAKRWVAAAVLWAQGASLKRIEDEVNLSCGETSRHVVRVSDLLAEMQTAAEVLGVPREHASEPLEAAQRAVRRGLPFMRRCLPRDAF